MKQCLALAGLACLLAAGCAQTGLNRGAQAGYVTSSQQAPRPAIARDFRKPGGEPFAQLAAYNEGCDTGCGMCDGGCGCPVDGGCTDGCCSDPCGGGPCRRLVDGMAGGFCGCGCGGPCGLCPGGQSYPEYPAFNPGPPGGQVAYPYYTTRGPRDFLRNNPPTIGPY